MKNQWKIAWLGAFLMLLGLQNPVSAQTTGLKLGSAPGTKEANAILDLGVGNRGLLLPRVALTNTASISPLTGIVQAGMVVYNTATVGDVTPGFYLYNGSTWVRVEGSSTNLYTADGTLAGNRTVTMNSNLLTFQGSEAGAGDAANQSLLRLFRPGTLGQRFSPAADFQVGGYNSGNTNASTRLNIRLSDGTVNSPDVNVMTLLGNGRVGIGTTTPTQSLHVVGNTLISGLSGTGTRMVVADATGLLTTQTIPTTGNLYTVDGTLAGVRTVSQVTNDLIFSGVGELKKYSGGASVSSVFTVGRTADELDMGVSGNVRRGFRWFCCRGWLD